ncbi:MAG: VWA domain-containing protein [Vicinamibacterales bacterium]
MNRFSLGIAGAACVMALTPVSTPVAQTQQDPVASFSVNVDAVALDVIVTEANGRFVNGLTEADFLVLENGIPQKLQLFTADVTPVTVLVLLDSSASVRTHLNDVKAAANRFINRLPRGDAARIGFFHDRVVFGPRFTDNMKEHVAMINQMRPQRSTHLFDAVIEALEALADVRARKALLLFTDGDDEGSTASMQEALEAARRSQAAVYSIGLLGWSSGEGMETNEPLLTQMAADTGGRAFFPKDEKEMRRSFDMMSDELHRQYRMTYFPSDASQPGWRTVDVKMTKRMNLVVRTRSGYVAAGTGSQ